jgi:lipopolysaccharide transport system ATP-binding protein
MSTVIEVDDLWKKYRLGIIGTGTLRHDFERWWHRVRGKPDPHSKVDQMAKAESRNTKVESPNGESDGDLGDDEMWALRGVSFEVKQGEILGVIGRNGAGKSTMLKILSRVTAPTSGEVRVKGRIASLLEVGTGFHAELTGRENVFLNGAILGMTKVEIRKKLDEIVDFAGVERYMDTPVKRYSSGMYVRLAFAVAAHLETEILICDEVLAVGDMAFQKKCVNKMGEVANSGRTVIFVSHNLDMIKKLCRRAALLADGRLQSLGAVEEVADSYLSSFVSQGEGIRSEKKIHGTTLDISKVTFLNEELQPVSLVATWSYLVIEVAFNAIGESPPTSIGVRISSATGTVINLCSTQPDENLDLPVNPGPNVARLHFPKLPLAAGEYVAEIAIAITNVEVVSLIEVKFFVEPTDVFKSGTAPFARRFPVVFDHCWELGVDPRRLQQSPVCKTTSRV